MSGSFETERDTIPMKNSTQHLIAEVFRRQARVDTTIGIDLGDVWSHSCKLNEDGEVVDRGRFRATPKAIEKWFTDLPLARISAQLRACSTAVGPAFAANRGVYERLGGLPVIEKVVVSQLTKITCSESRFIGHLPRRLIGLSGSMSDDQRSTPGNISRCALRLSGTDRTQITGSNPAFDS